MYCKYCRFRCGDGDCQNPKIREEYCGDSDDNDSLVYSYNEGGYFTVGDYFGCVHFDKRDS